MEAYYFGRMLFLICLMIGFSDFGLASLDRCPPIVKSRHLQNYYSTSFREKCYTFIHDTKTWVGAESHCNSMGGDLVSIPDKATMDFIKIALGRQRWSVNYIWNGLNARRGDWKWSNGKHIAYSYWASGQPSTILGISFEDCGCMKRTHSWRWHDCHCDAFYEKNRYICEFGMLPRTTTTTTTTTSTSTTTTTTTPLPTTPRPTTTTTLLSTTTTRKLTSPSTKLPKVVIPVTTQTSPSTTPSIVVVMKFNPNSNKVDSKSRTHHKPEYHGIHQDPSQVASQSEETSSTVDKSGLIIGFIIGGILILALVVFGFVFFRRRRRKQAKEEMSVRFENLAYARVNQTDSQRPQSNIYMDANEMNRLYEEVTKQVDHGVNYYVNNSAPPLPIQGGATGCSEDMDDSDLKKVNRVRKPEEEDCSAPATSGDVNNETNTSRESEYMDMTGASAHGPKETNLYMEAHRVVDPEKPSNIQREPIYNNGPGSLPPEPASVDCSHQGLANQEINTKDDHLYDTLK